MKVIGHIDADCFYVSCERVRNPFLKGKPVAVLGNQGACVIARSYELKPFKVKVGMPVWEAKKLCPDIIYVKRDFRWYGILSAKFNEILRKYSDTIEYYSIDESFLDFGNFLGNWEELGLKIQKEVLGEIGIPVSVGISLSRILAKTASDKNKPFGVTVVNKSNLEAFLKSVPVTDVVGIGDRLFERIKDYGILTAWDYVNKPASLIKKLVYKPGEEIWYELQGRSILPIRTERPQKKCVSRGGSIWGHYSDKKYIWAFLMRNLERLLDALWKDNLEILNLFVWLITSSGYALKHVEKLPDYTNSYSVLVSALQKSFEKIYFSGFTYSAVHVAGMPVRDSLNKQLGLFEIESEKQKKIVSLKKTLNQKFGIFAVRSAVTAYAPEIFKDISSDYEICDIEGKFCF